MARLDFGNMAEKFARMLGTPKYLFAQSAVMTLWVSLNILVFTKTIHWDPYPFILLNLLLSTQAAYAAPLIMVAQNRESERAAERDEKRDAQHLALEKLADEKLDKIIHKLYKRSKRG